MQKQMSQPQSDYCAAPDISYLRKITTEKGIWQHTKGSEPDLAMGYSIDDIARALIVVNRASSLFPELNSTTDDHRSLADLADIYLGYIEKNQHDDGSFHNFDSSEGTPLDQMGSEDSYGRTIWALGDTLKNGITEEQRQRADRIFTKASEYLVAQEFVRANCFIILGIVSSFAYERVPERYEVLKTLMRKKINAFRKESTTDWRWFEPDMRYSNGVIPLAILRGAEALEKTDKDIASEARVIALEALDFLLRASEHEGVPAPIGNHGWYERGKEKALYDQQPVDAAAMVLACLEAFRVTKKEEYKESAEAWLKWYEGNNISGKTMLKENGAVFDGIQEDGINNNCGAESIVTYLLARLRWAEVFCVK